MSSKSIRCAHDDRFEVNIGDILTHDGEPRVYVQGRVGSTERFLANPTRADFLDAIRTELNVIVIDKAELPEVTRDGDHIRIDGRIAWPVNLAHKHAAEIKQDALDGLALAAYLEANPPIDLAQVAVFNQALIEVEMDHSDGPVPFKVATDLVKAGYRITKDPS